MAELLVCREFDRVDKAPFMNVYKESSSENAVRWYPELSAEAALQKYEEGYADYMAHGFADEGGLSFILQENGVYVCALRLFPRGDGQFYLEALETHPAYRQRGYGTQLLNKMTAYLAAENPFFTVTSHVKKTNTASIRTHLAAGFIIAADYVVEDGERFDGDFLLEYRRPQKPLL